jgi:AcrR family transcriptional regulator
LLAGGHTAAGLPRGRHRLPSEQVSDDQRRRILRAMVAVVAEQGFAATTVAEVVRRAKVSRTSFYAQFADREACFVAAIAAGRRLLVDAVSTAVQDQPVSASDVDLLRAGLRAYLAFLRDEPAFATAFYLELPSVGRQGGERLAEARSKLTARTAVWHSRARTRHPDWPQVPAEVYRALTAATEELVSARVRAGEADRLPELEDVVVALHLRLLTEGAWVKPLPLPPASG